MLDYAANGIEYWSMDRLRQAAAETARACGKSLDAEILELIQSEDEADIEDYWQLVESNLRSGKVRRVFAADHTPRELRHLVEFLNEKMADVELLAVEVKQFVGQEGHKAIVPRAVGLTEAARRAKRGGDRKRHVSREEFLANCTPEATEFFRQVLDLAVEKGHTISWGTLGFSVRAYFPKAERPTSFTYGWPPDTFEFYFGQLSIPEDLALALRKDLLAFGVFEEAGEKTLRAKLEGETLNRIPEVYAFILEKMDEIIQAY